MTTTRTFDIEAIPPGTKGIFYLSLSLGTELEGLEDQIILNLTRIAPRDQIRAGISQWISGKSLLIPVLVARGSVAGKTLVATAGVHGDEYEGPEAIYRVFDRLDPSRMRGTFLGVPIVNPPAFWLGMRASPIDLLNLARVFPGSADGNLSERLAWSLLDRVLRHASLYIDLHSAGRNYHMVTMCGYCTAGTQAETAKQAAFHSDLPVVWAHPSVSPGRTISATLDLNIPSLYTEAYGGGHARPEDIEDYDRCLTLLLGFLEITQLALPERPSRRRLFLGGSGDLDVAINCEQGGFFVGAAKVGEYVRKGETLGTVRDREGKLLEELVSPENGFLTIIRATPMVFGGEFIAALAEEQSANFPGRSATVA